MKQTVLVCDWSTTRPREFAVASVALTNGHGTKGVAQLDLCAKHYNEALRLFQPRSRPGPAPGTKQRVVRRPTTSTKRKDNYEKRYQQREALVLKGFKKGEWVQTPELCKATGLNNHRMTHILRTRLLPRKLVTRRGKGPHTEYMLA